MQILVVTFYVEYFQKKININTKLIYDSKYLEYKDTDLSDKNIKIKYNNRNYKDISELDKDKYLLLLDDNNLITAFLI